MHFTPLQKWQASPYAWLSKLKLSFYKNRLGVKQENQWTRLQTLNRGLQSSVKHLSPSRHVSRTRSKATPGTNPSPPNSTSCTRLLQVVENRAEELMKTSALLSHFFDTVSSAVVRKSSWGWLSFSCQQTCSNYSLTLRSLLGASSEPRKALPAHIAQTHRTHKRNYRFSAP